jgi:hypothetical protein
MLAPGAARAAAPVAVVYRQLFELPHAVAGHQRRLAMRSCTCSRSKFNSAKRSALDQARGTIDAAEVSVQGSSGSTCSPATA